MNARLKFSLTAALVVVVGLTLFTTPLASAQIRGLTEGDCGKVGIGCSEGDNTGTLRSYALAVINIFLGLVGVVAFIFILLGGARYIASRGDEGEAEAAKKTILYAVIGIVIIGLAAIIVNFTLQAAGVGGELPGGSDLQGSILTIVNIFLGLVGVTALIFVLIGGVRYISAQGDEGQAETAKKTILYAVIGVVVVGIAAVIVNFAGQAVGLSTGLPGGNNLRGTVLTIINFFLGLVGVTALAFVLIGAVRYITSQGDESQAETAKKTILYAIIGLLVVGMAAVVVNFVATAVDLPTGLTASNDLPGAILYVINIFLVLAAIVALVFIIYGGVQYITSRGDSDKAENAKLTILYAIIGLIVIGLSAVLVNFVISAFL